MRIMCFRGETILNAFCWRIWLSWHESCSLYNALKAQPTTTNHPPTRATPLNGVLVDILFNMHIFISFCQSDCQHCARDLRQSERQGGGGMEWGNGEWGTDGTEATFSQRFLHLAVLKSLYKLQGKRAGWRADELLGILFFWFFFTFFFKGACQLGRSKKTWKLDFLIFYAVITAVCGLKTQTYTI